MFTQQRKIGQNITLYKVNLESNEKSDDYTPIDKCFTEGREPFFILNFTFMNPMDILRTHDNTSINDSTIQSIKMVTCPVTDHEDDDELTKSNKFYRLCLYDSATGHRFLDFLKK